MAWSADRGASPTQASSTLTINQNVDASFSGTFHGAGNIIKTGTGRLTLPFSHLLTGTISVFEGTLIIDGPWAGSATVAPGAVLGGSGTIAKGLFATGGTVAPGSSPGILGAGGLSLSSNSMLSLELNGPAAGAGYDQVAVTGAVSLGGSALGISLGYAPAPGTVFTIITNDGVEPVSGAFAGLPQGTVISVNGTPLVISYTGGTGNDVVLIAGTSRILDVDANGSYDALTDGLLIIRYLFGLTGPSLTNGALGITATRADPTLIKTYLDGVRPLLDIDGNGDRAVCLVLDAVATPCLELIRVASSPLIVREAADRARSCYSRDRSSSARIAAVTVVTGSPRAPAIRYPPRSPRAPEPAP